MLEGPGVITIHRETKCVSHLTKDLITNHKGENSVCKSRIIKIPPATPHISCAGTRHDGLVAIGVKHARPRSSDPSDRSSSLCGDAAEVV